MDLEDNSLYEGDCLSLLRRVTDSSVDLGFYSPPYFDLHDYTPETAEIGRGQTMEGYLASMAAVNREYARVLKPTGSLVINVMDLVRDNRPVPLADMLIAGVPQLRCVAKIVWFIRNKMPVASSRRFCNKFEWIIHLAKGDGYYFDKDSVREPHGKWGAIDSIRRPEKWNPKGKCPGNMWDIKAYRVAGKRKYHKAAFPVELADRVVKAWCPPGGVVLDAFNGSGTTTLSAAKSGRRWIGFELDATYHETALLRHSGHLP